MMSMFQALATSLLHMIAQTAYANVPNVDQAMNLVGGQLSNGAGAPGEFGGIAATIAANFLPLLDLMAAIVIVIAGILAVIAQDENRIAATRKVVSGALVAIVLVRVAGSFAKVLILQFLDSNSGSGVELLRSEVFGFLSWIEVPVLLFALLTIVISGIRTLISFGGDQGLTQLRQTIVSVIFGIILIVIKLVVSAAVVTGVPDPLLDIGTNLTLTILLYMGLAAVVVLVVAGIYMIVNIGNDEQYTRAKSLVVRVITGLMVIIVAGALVTLIVDALLTP